LEELTANTFTKISSSVLKMDAEAFSINFSFIVENSLKACGASLEFLGSACGRNFGFVRG